MKFGFFIFLLVFLLPQLVFASVCSQDGYTALTINGVFTNQAGAKNNAFALQRKLGDSYDNESLKVDFLLNPSHAGGFGDLIDAAQQGLFDEKSDYDLIEMLNDASQKVTTQKLLLVGHSQGNFYANNFYNSVADKIGGVSGNSIGVYAVATPASHVAGGGNYITSDTDKVISAVVGRVLKILPPNTHILFQPSDDPDGHSFSDVYLKYQGARIVSDIQNSLDKLQTNNIQNAYMPCIDPPAVTFTHELQGNLLSLIDHPVDFGKAGIELAKNTIKNAGLAIGNKVIKIASNIYSLAKSLAGKTSNNTAAVILADITAPQNTSSEPKESVKENSKPKPLTKSPVSQNVATEAAPPFVAKTAKETSETTTLPLAPLLNQGGDGNGNSTEIPYPNLLPGGGGRSAASLPLPDIIAPVISLIGANPVTVEAGAIYTEFGATATDNVNGSITVIITGTVNTVLIGAYTKTYTATDLSGNIATVTRTVNVVDTTAPAAPIISTSAQTVSTNTINIVGTAEASSTITISGGASVATGTATGGNYSITVTLNTNAVNTLSVTAKDAANNTSSPATVLITHVPPVTILYDSRSTYPYTPPPTQSGGTNGDLWNTSGGGAPSGGTVKTVNAVLVTKPAFNASGTFQLRCLVDTGGGLGFQTAAESVFFNTNDHLTSSGVFDFAPYGSDTWKYADVTFTNPFGNNCVYAAGNNVRISSVSPVGEAVLYIGNSSGSTLPQHRMYITN